MNNIKKYKEQCEAIRNPGVEIGKFLLGHSNSPTYLVG